MSVPARCEACVAGEPNQLGHVATYPKKVALHHDLIARLRAEFQAQFVKQLTLEAEDERLLAQLTEWTTRSIEVGKRAESAERERDDLRRGISDALNEAHRAMCSVKWHADAMNALLRDLLAERPAEVDRMCSVKWHADAMNALLRDLLAERPKEGT